MEIGEITKEIYTIEIHVYMMVKEIYIVYDKHIEIFVRQLDISCTCFQCVIDCNDWVCKETCYSLFYFMYVFESICSNNNDAYSLEN